jgi:hypothetical protein
MQFRPDGGDAGFDARRAAAAAASSFSVPSCSSLMLSLSLSLCRLYIYLPTFCFSFFLSLPWLRHVFAEEVPCLLLWQGRFFF